MLNEWIAADDKAVRELISRDRLCLSSMREREILLVSISAASADGRHESELFCLELESCLSRRVSLSFAYLRPDKQGLFQHTYHFVYHLLYASSSLLLILRLRYDSCHCQSRLFLHTPYLKLNLRSVCIVHRTWLPPTKCFINNCSYAHLVQEWTLVNNVTMIEIN